MVNRYEWVDGALLVETAETKTLDDVYRVAEAGKPLAVVDRVIAMYLTGLDPHQDVKDRWYRLQQQIDALQALTVDLLAETLTSNAADDTEITPVVVRPARELTEEESQTLLAALHERRYLETGIKTVAVQRPADIAEWDADQIEQWAQATYGLNIDKRFSVANILADQVPNTVEQQDEQFYPWLATYRGETADVPPLYVVTEEAVAAFKASDARLHRTLRDRAVEQIIVQPEPELSLQGDEMSQARMARALVVALGEAVVHLSPEVAQLTTPWKDANNQVQQVSIGALLTALRRAGEKQTEVFTGVANH